MRARGLALTAATLLLSLAACIGDTPERELIGEPLPQPTGTPAATGTTGAAPTPTSGFSAVTVGLAEYRVTATPATVPPGFVTFTVTNAGTMQHEFKVLRTDHPPDALPMFGPRADETAPGVLLVGRIDPFPADAGKQIVVPVNAGQFVLLCNLPDHYRLGMRLRFVVG